MATALLRTEIDDIVILLEQSPIGSLNRIRTFILKTRPTRFIRLFERLVETRNNEAFDVLLYYLLLMRDEGRVRLLFRKLSKNQILLEKVILFALGRALAKARPIKAAFDRILFFFDQETQLSLLLNSKSIASDRTLTMHLLTKLSPESVERYFSQKEHIGSFLNGFMRLPEYSIRNFIATNPSLFAHLQNFLLKLQDEQEVRAFMEKFGGEMQAVDWIERIRSESAAIRIRKDVSFDRRNWLHLNFIVREVHKSDDPRDAIDVFGREDIFISPEERILVSDLFSNPLLEPVLRKMLARIAPMEAQPESLSRLSL